MSLPVIWRWMGDRVLTSDTVFEQRDLGRRGAVIGLGPLGVELGQALARLGCEVYGFGRSERVAGLTDPEVNRGMLALPGEEMRIASGREVELLPADSDSLRVRAGGEEVEVDWAIAAIGRRPNIEGLGLEALGVEFNERQVPLFDPSTLQIGTLPLYIAGDVSGLRPLMHEA